MNGTIIWNHGCNYLHHPSGWNVRSLLHRVSITYEWYRLGEFNERVCNGCIHKADTGRNCLVCHGDSHRPAGYGYTGKPRRQVWCALYEPPKEKSINVRLKQFNEKTKSDAKMKASDFAYDRLKCPDHPCRTAWAFWCSDWANHTYLDSIESIRLSLIY